MKTIIAGDAEYRHIPAGECLIGTPEGDPLAWSDEHPQHVYMIDYDYWCARTPVTNRQFERFINETGQITQAEKQGWAFVFNPKPMEWEKTEGADWCHPTGPESSYTLGPDHPVVSVSFLDALAYLDWLNQTAVEELPSGYKFALPTEVEWEKAARGPDGKVFPWSDEFDPGRCNWIEGRNEIGTTPVDHFSPAGDSVFGCADMAGNTWDWTTTRWGPKKDEQLFVYPYDPDDGREDQIAGQSDYRIIRGGSFKNELQAMRSACRDLDPPNWALNNLGFRVFILPE